jgi:hypothetical protein
MKSKKVISAHSRVDYWLKGLRSAQWEEFNAYAASDEDKAMVMAAHEILWDLQKDVDRFFAPKIGAAIIDEGRDGKL